MSDQATALDQALFRLHEDLYAFVEDAKDLFRQVVDRLPPGRADLGEVRIYLTALIRLAEQRSVAARPAPRCA